jgi:predicted DNA-binding protein (UPF0251 family)
VRQSLEEAEAIRLKELEDLAQEQSAVRMNISRPTFQWVLESARKKVADALLNGKAIRIDGGNFEFQEAPPGTSGAPDIAHGRHGHCRGMGFRGGF